MSTRSTIWYREETDETFGLHVYHELTSDNDIHLEVSCGPFLAIVPLPAEMLDTLVRLRSSELSPMKTEGETR